MQWIVEALQSNLSSLLSYTIPNLLESISADASGPERQLCTSWGLKLLGGSHTPSWFYYQGYAENTQPRTQASESLPDVRSLHPMSTEHHAWMPSKQL